MQQLERDGVDVSDRLVPPPILEPHQKLFIDAYKVLRRSKRHLHHITISEINSYIDIFPQHCSQTFTTMIYHIDDTIVEHEIEKHNKEIEKIKNG